MTADDRCGATRLSDGARCIRGKGHTGPHNGPPPHPPDPTSAEQVPEEATP